MRTAWRVARVVLAAAGLVFLVVALVDSWHRSASLLRSPVRIGTALLAIGVGLVLWANAWSALVRGTSGPRAIRGGFYLSQLGKYVPGGIWQAAGIVTLARDAGVDLADASAGFVVLAVTQVAGAATVGGCAAIVATGLPGAVRVAMIAGLLLAGLVHRRWMVALLRFAGRYVKRVEGQTVPEQSAILASYAWSVAATAFAAVSFVVLASPSSAGVGMAAGAAFATAWWIGFVAVPFPSGIGIREAVLLAVLHPVMSSGAILGAAIGQRLASIAAELVLITTTGGARLRSWRAGRRDADEPG